MEITKSKVNGWNLAKEHGDIQKIYDSGKRKNGTHIVGKDKIRDAFYFGYADEATEKLIDAFFAKRKQQAA